MCLTIKTYSLTALDENNLVLKVTDLNFKILMFFLYYILMVHVLPLAFGIKIQRIGLPH